MTDDISKVVREKPAPSYAPVYAAALYPQLATIARRHGYALAAHGSLQRDFDLIGIPWADNPSEPEAVVAEFTSTFAIREVGGPPSDKPHGRRTWSLSIGFAECAIDLSFMPRRLESATTPAEVGDEILAWRFDYCGTHAMVWLNRPADAAMFANVTPLVDARYAATLARQLAEAKAEIAALSDDVAEYQRNIDAESFALTKAESQLAAATPKDQPAQGVDGE